MITVDLKAKDSYALGALFSFIPINLSIWFGASSPSGSTAFPSPLMELRSAGSSWCPEVLSSGFPRPEAPGGPLAVRGACLHLFQPNDCDETLVFFFFESFKHL